MWQCVWSFASIRNGFERMEKCEHVCHVLDTTFRRRRRILLEPCSRRRARWSDVRYAGGLPREPEHRLWESGWRDKAHPVATGLNDRKSQQLRAHRFWERVDHQWKWGKRGGVEGPRKRDSRLLGDLLDQARLSPYLPSTCTLKNMANKGQAVQEHLFVRHIHDHRLAEKMNPRLKCHVPDGRRGGRSSIVGRTSGARSTWIVRHRCATSWSKMGSQEPCLCRERDSCARFHAARRAWRNRAISWSGRLKSMVTDSLLARMEVANWPKSIAEEMCFVARPPTEEHSPMRSSIPPTAACECPRNGTRQLRKFPTDVLSRSLFATGHDAVSNQKMGSVQNHDKCWGGSSAQDEAEITRGWRHCQGGSAGRDEWEGVTQHDQRVWQHVRSVPLPPWEVPGDVGARPKAFEGASAECRPTLWINHDEGTVKQVGGGVVCWPTWSGRIAAVRVRHRRLHDYEPSGLEFYRRNKENASIGSEGGDRRVSTSHHPHPLGFQNLPSLWPAGTHLRGRQVHLPLDVIPVAAGIRFIGLWDC